jgi:hypothetical protein
MARPHVGIRKIHTDQIKMAYKVHLAEMDFLRHFSKVGLFAPALVIEIVNSHFSMPTARATHTTFPQPHSTRC